MNKESEHGKMTVGEAGRKGGVTTSERYNREFYQKIGKKGGNERSKRLKKYGVSSYMHKILSEAGRKGGIATKEKHGHDYYVEIGRKGGSVPRKKRT